MNTRPITFEIFMSSSVQSSKLIVPGVRPRINCSCETFNHDSLERQISPNLSDLNAMKSVRDLIPGTPSPTYAYESCLRYPDNDQRAMPRFFPFLVSASGSSETAETATGSFPSSQATTPSITTSTPVIERSISPTLSDPTLLSQLRTTAGQSHLSLADVLPEALQFSQDQFGSRFLQQSMEVASAADTHQLFLALLPAVQKLALDPFGNYVIQKLLDHLPGEHRALLGEQLLGHILVLSLHTYGCRVIQRILDTPPSALGYRGVTLLRSIAAELKGSVVKCVEDQNGNHVIQKCVEKLSLDEARFIPDEIQGKVERLSLHCYGCRVIQRLLERLPTASQQSVFVTAEILRSLRTLAQDQYGNYVVQHLLSHGLPESRDAVASAVALRVTEFATHKFASNVAERALVNGSPPAKSKIIAALLGCEGSDSPVLTLAKDRFANYVVQRALELSSGTQRERMLSVLVTLLPTLRKVPYGKHIATAVEQIVGKRGNQ